MATLSLQRSKKLLEDQGFKVAIVERWNQWAHIRQDLFNMCDLIGIRWDRKGVTGVQCCGEDVQPHIQKLLEGYTDAKGRAVPPNIYLKVWLSAGNPFFIWAWRKRGERGRRKTWQMKEIEFLIEAGQVVHREMPSETKED